MEIRISVFFNDIESRSEVFLRQLFDVLSLDCGVEYLSLKKPQKRFASNRVAYRSISRPVSYDFIVNYLYLVLKYKTISPRRIYYIYILERASSKILYFPFLYMLVPFKDVLKDFLKVNPQCRLFTSVRGTEVTLEPHLKGQVVVDCYRDLLVNVYKVHFLSERLYFDFTSIGLSHLNTQIIYQGIDRNKFSFVSVPRDKLKIISVGRFDYIKGFDFLLLSLADLKRRSVDFRCTIVGYGPEKAKIKYMLSDLDLLNNVEIIENVDHNNLPKILAKHNTYVHTHLVNGISNTMLEAFSCGLKVITFESDFASYAIPGIKENFIQVPRYRFDKLAEALELGWYVNFPVKEVVDSVLYPFELNNQKLNFLSFFDVKLN